MPFEFGLAAEGATGEAIKEGLAAEDAEGPPKLPLDTGVLRFALAEPAVDLVACNFSDFATLSNDTSVGAEEDAAGAAATDFAVVLALLPVALMSADKSKEGGVDNFCGDSCCGLGRLDEAAEEGAATGSSAFSESLSSLILNGSDFPAAP